MHLIILYDGFIGTVFTKIWAILHSISIVNSLNPNIWNPFFLTYADDFFSSGGIHLIAQIDFTDSEKLVIIGTVNFHCFVIPYKTPFVLMKTAVPIRNLWMNITSESQQPAWRNGETAVFPTDMNPVLFSS